MRKTFLAALLSFALLADAGSAALAGDIQGTIVIKSSLRPRATGKVTAGGGPSSGYGGTSGYSDDGPPTLSRDQEVPYVVISVAGKNLPATPHAYVMHQKGREFSPHVLPVVKGSTVQFTNEDPFFHSIYSESSAGQFQLPKYARGKKETKTFSTPGAIELFCGIHSRMNAYIYVTDSDFFAQPSADKKYVIRGLPAGTYTLKIWHPRANPRTETVTVPASGVVTKDLSL